MKNFLFLFSLIALLIGSCGTDQEPKNIYIVRHAEKHLSGNDPDLAEVGKIRAKKLAQILKDQEIKHIFSTNFKRTRLTAKPTAELFNLNIQTYSPSDQDELAEKLRSLKGNILVIGHSNTVSRLANYLGGSKTEFKDLEDIEYDYIYEVKLTKNGSSVDRKLYKDY